MGVVDITLRRQTVLCLDEEGIKMVFVCVLNIWHCLDSKENEIKYSEATKKQLSSYIELKRKEFKISLQRVN